MNEQHFSVLPRSKGRETAILTGSRARLIQTIVVLLVVRCSALGQMALSTLKTGTPQAWVERAAPEARTVIKSDQESGGQVLTLIETQINAATAEMFVHVAKEIPRWKTVIEAAKIKVD